MTKAQVELLKAIGRFLLANIPKRTGCQWEEDSLLKALVAVEQEGT